MYHALAPVAGFIRHHLSEVCLGITAVTLLVAGPLINGFVRKLTERFHWLVRFIILVLLLTAGYGLLAHLIFTCLKRWLAPQPALSLIVITAAIYLALALFAQKQGKI
jgi:hypothetical protein